MFPSIDFLLFLQAFIMLFAVFDPIGTIPVIMSVTSHLPLKERRKVIKESLTFAFFLLIMFAYLGLWFLNLLNISFSDFKIAGGALLLILAIEDMVIEKRRYRATIAEDVALVPIGTPLLAGPGSIITVMILTREPFNHFIAFSSIILNVILAWIIFSLSDRLSKILGERGTRAIGKVMALIIASFAIKFMREGIMESFFS